MKAFRDFVDTLTAIQKLWVLLAFVIPVLFGFVSRAFSVVSEITIVDGTGTAIFHFSLPLPILALIIVLALYPVVVFLGLLTRPTQEFGYKGLRWRPPRFGFGHAQPICPHSDCGCEVIVEMKQRTVVSETNLPNLMVPYTKFDYVYRCPLHGQLNGVPNLSIEQFSEEALIVHRAQTKRKGPGRR